MIIFRVGEKLYEYEGVIGVQTQEKYIFEKKNPFNPTLSFQYGRYFQDNLEISIIAEAEQYEQMYYGIADLISQNNPYIIAWRSITGYQYRLCKSLPPYPSEIMHLRDEVSMKLESMPYFEIQKDMANVTQNMIYGESTIDNTIWN